MSLCITFLSKLEEVWINFILFMTIMHIKSKNVSVLYLLVEWTVKRRYKEFAELHETLLDAGVQRESLPEKKYSFLTLKISIVTLCGVFLS